jgi:hypothetical protein
VGSPMYMSAKELLEKFGAGPKGKRRLSGDMVAWLLTDPPRVLVEAAAVLKAPVVPPPNTVVIVPPTTEIKTFTGFNFAQPPEDSYTAHIMSYTNIVGIPDRQSDGKLIFLRDDSAGNPRTD